MSKFNTKSEGTATVNLAGGRAYKETAKLELATLVLTSFLSGDKAYETEANIVKRLTNLYKKLNSSDKQFFAKAAVYARDKFRLRSISHLCSAIIAEGVVNDVYAEEDKKWLEGYFSKVIKRADDITETISAYSARPKAYRSKVGRIQLPNVMKRGLSKAVANYDSYVMAKYKQAGKKISLKDAMVMIHAQATDKNRDALKSLLDDTLKNTETWEAKQSQAGKAENKEEASKQAWAEFLDKGERIEYFALLRNLRNIIETNNNDLIDKACELLTNPKLISRSKVLPFRFQTAVDQITNRKVKSALTKAADISLSNIPEFSGRTAILLDTSGSMSCRISDKSQTTAMDIAALFAAALYKATDSDVIPFDMSVRPFNANPEDSVFTIANSVRAAGGGTYMSVGFQALKESYDRIFVLSDMQTWGENCYYGASTNSAFKKYKKEYNPNCRLYTFDFTGNGTIQFPENNVTCIAGFSEHIFEVLKNSETDKNYMVHEIENIVLG